MSQPNLDTNEIKKAVEDISGYPFELQIVRRIENWEEYGYFVQPNYSFEDHDSGEARELDFYANRAVTISTLKSQYAFIVLLGSCKSNKAPYVFFTREPPLVGYILNSDVPLSGCPLEIVDKNGEKEAVEWRLQLHTFLHIATSKSVSSQFCALQWEKEKWKVKSEAIMKDTFIPLIKAMSRQIEGHNDEISKRLSKAETERMLPEYNIYYPLLVLNGPLFEYHLSGKGDTTVTEVKHILVIRHYESKTVKCRYAIDVIHESYLEAYLDLVEGEVKRFVNIVRHNKRRIVDSIAPIRENGVDKVNGNG